MIIHREDFNLNQFAIVLQVKLSLLNKRGWGHGEGMLKRIKMRHVRFFIRETHPYPRAAFLWFVSFRRRKEMNIKNTPINRNLMPSASQIKYITQQPSM